MLGRSKASRLARLSDMFTVLDDRVDSQSVCFVWVRLLPGADAAFGCFLGMPSPVLLVLPKVVVEIFFLDSTPSLGQWRLNGGILLPTIFCGHRV